MRRFQIAPVAGSVAALVGEDAPLCWREVLARVRIERVAVDLAEQRLSAEVVGWGPAPDGFLEWLEERLGHAFTAASAVRLRWRPLDPQEAWATALEALRAALPMLGGLLNDVRSDWSKEGEVTVLAPAATLALLQHRGAVGLLEKRLRELGVAVAVRLVPEVEPEYEEAPWESQAQALAERIRAQVEADSERVVLLGDPVRGEPVAMALLQQEGERAVVRGRVIGKELRALRGGGILVTVDVTDFTDSLTLKAFLKPEETGRWEGVSEGQWLLARGQLVYDRYAREVVLNLEACERIPPAVRADRATAKRCELNLHTRLSAMDGIMDAQAAVRRAKEWGWAAIAITDHGVVQAFPEAYEAGRKHGVQVVLGMEAYLVDDAPRFVIGLAAEREGEPLPSRYVAIDLETTGLSPLAHDVIEIGAARYEDGNLVATWQTFVKPSRPVPPEVQELTGIDPAWLEGAPGPAEALGQFLAFVSGDLLVAHNAGFDAYFLDYHLRTVLARRLENPVLDTLWLARACLPSQRSHALPQTAQALGVPLNQHHRALADAVSAGAVLARLLQTEPLRSVERLGALDLLAQAVPTALLRPQPCTLLAQDQTGLRNLYQLVTRSHMEFFHRVPRLPKSLLAKHRQGLLIGVGAERSELVERLLAGADDAELEAVASWYDYLEVYPCDNWDHLLAGGMLRSRADLEAVQQRLVALGRRLGRPVVAVGDAHYLDEEDAIHRQILRHGQGPGDEPIGPLHLRTTDEMLQAFAHLGEETAHEVVVQAPAALVARIEPDLKPVPDGLFAPQLERAEEEVAEGARRQAHAWYGDPLPPLVAERLETELRSILGHGFAGLYLIAARLVQRSLADGYLVGSRGSVGSSFVATCLGITEVNPLPPHYRCPACRYTEFVAAGTAGAGFDLPTKACPRCGAALVGDGHDIPFAVFMGFEGDKVPDIDLNFSGEYQTRAHKAAEELLGPENVFRAGTISTVAERTAFGLARGFLEETQHGRHVRQAELKRLALGCTGVKRTTGQHPGGLMVVPRGEDIYRFTPLQYPANDPTSGQITTHFDYHSIEGRLVKLDLLGHDDPTVLRQLQDLTGIDVRSLPLNDPATLKLFSGLESLGVRPEEVGFEVGSVGLPEFGTRFVRGMLVDTRPQTFADLVRISGLSHGTDVWANNARDLVQAKTARLDEVIATRDDIMLYLIQKGVPQKTAFAIGERVRKGKGLREEDIEAMQAAQVPDWYIGSCQKISYLFPKAHAVAYVMMAFRIAWFKVHQPAAFYATYFSVRASEFDARWAAQTPAAWRATLAALEAKGNEASPKEKGQVVLLEVLLEMAARGFRLLPVDLHRSHATRFLIEDDRHLRVPLAAVEGLGDKAAHNLVQAREEAPFLSLADLRARGKVTRNVVELLQALGALGDLPEDNQMSLF